jgi:hypothetical protein
MIRARWIFLRRCWRSSEEKKSVGGIDCRVLSLEALIKAKEAAARPRDLYVLPELRALAELKRKTGTE